MNNKQIRNHVAKMVCHNASNYGILITKKVVAYVVSRLQLGKAAVDVVTELINFKHQLIAA